MKGVPLWRSVVNDWCATQNAGPGLWRCMLGVYAARYIRHVDTMFFIQFRFDLAQLGHDGIYHKPATAAEQRYAQANAPNVTAQLQLAYKAAKANGIPHAGYFSPSCYLHTVAWRADWLNLTIGTVNLWQAFQSDRTIWDNCNRANCNPTCPT